MTFIHNYITVVLVLVAVDVDVIVIIMFSFFAQNAAGQASHARTVVRECCKGDDESQWELGKFDPPPPKNPLTDGHQNLCT